MSSSEADTAGHYLPPGTRVINRGRDDGILEHGIVVHCWFDDAIQGYDCYVAYFEGDWPKDVPQHRPGIVRMGAIFLSIVEEGKP